MTRAQCCMEPRPSLPARTETVPATALGLSEQSEGNARSDKCIFDFEDDIVDASSFISQQPLSHLNVFSLQLVIFFVQICLGLSNSWREMQGVIDVFLTLRMILQMQVLIIFFFFFFFGLLSISSSISTSLLCPFLPLCQFFLGKYISVIGSIWI